MEIDETMLLCGRVLKAQFSRLDRFGSFFSVRNEVAICEGVRVKEVGNRLRPMG
jgi:hypothetical protein